MRVVLRRLCILKSTSHQIYGICRVCMYVLINRLEYISISKTILLYENLSSANLKYFITNNTYFYMLSVIYWDEYWKYDIGENPRTKLLILKIYITRGCINCERFRREDIILKLFNCTPGATKLTTVWYDYITIVLNLTPGSKYLAYEVKLA